MTKKIYIRKIDKQDQKAVIDILRKRWGSEKIVYQGKVFYADKLPGFIACSGDKIVGLLTYKVANNVCQIITFDALIKRKGIGTALIKKIIGVGEKSNWSKIIVITTNDNLDALRFYQRRGFVLEKIYKNSVKKSRKVKPTIPEIGDYKIPIRDEIELEFRLI